MQFHTSTIETPLVSEMIPYAPLSIDSIQLVSESILTTLVAQEQIRTMHTANLKAFMV